MIDFISVFSKFFFAMVSVTEVNLRNDSLKFAGPEGLLQRDSHEEPPGA